MKLFNMVAFIRKAYGVLTSLHENVTSSPTLNEAALSGASTVVTAVPNLTLNLISAQPSENIRV